MLVFSEPTDSFLQPEWVNEYHALKASKDWSVFLGGRIVNTIYLPEIMIRSTEYKRVLTTIIYARLLLRMMWPHGRL